MKTLFKATTIVLIITVYALAKPSDWRQATQKELKALIPERAPVGKERIETEFRTASGVTNGQGKFIAGVVMITAGYEAEGKYSHFFITQVPVKVGQVSLQPGEYVYGFNKKDDDTLNVMFYEAATGKLMGNVEARKGSKHGPIRSLLINPPKNGKSTILIGRFLFEYTLNE